MPSKQIEEFAQILIRAVRDRAIRGCDIGRRPDSQSPNAKLWRKLGVAGCDPLVEEVIAECVDATLFYLLFSIDEEWLKLQFITKDGEVVDLLREGEAELRGWLVGGLDGWPAKYSEERLSFLTRPEPDPNEPQA